MSPFNANIGVYPSPRSNSKLKLSMTIISARNLKTLNSINDPLLKIKRSVARFGKDMIEVAQKELNYSIEV